MIRMTITGANLEPIIAFLDRVARPDLLPLAEEIRGVMIDDNREGLLAGTNDDGGMAAPVKESTILRGRGGDGPPRVPSLAGSRMITDYDVQVQQSFEKIILVGSWPNSPWVRFHATGTARMAARNPVGIRPDGQARIAERVAAFVDRLMASPV